MSARTRNANDRPDMHAEGQERKGQLNRVKEGSKTPGQHELTKSHERGAKTLERIPPKDEMIAYAKAWLKAKGFRKKNTRWSKDTGAFTICFYLQGSCYSKEHYYIRPGIFINALMPTMRTYGHWSFEIMSGSAEEIMATFDQWCSEWTDKALIRSRVLAYEEWAKRREAQADDDTAALPAHECFHMDPLPGEASVRQYILEHF